MMIVISGGTGSNFSCHALLPCESMTWTNERHPLVSVHSNEAPRLNGCSNSSVRRGGVTVRRRSLFAFC